MGIIAVDHPDEVVHWFAVYPEAQRQRRVTGACPHDCEHRLTATVAWGPDRAHYELWTCNEGCAGNCRAWARANITHAEIVALEWKLLEGI